jgi:hypothetical protein
VFEIRGYGTIRESPKPKEDKGDNTMSQGCIVRPIPPPPSPPPTAKPPLGIMPRYIHDEQRLNDLCLAINRYITGNKAIPIEWIEEYNELVKRLKLSD